jgi:hypothetical protein
MNTVVVATMQHGFDPLFQRIMVRSRPLGRFTPPDDQTRLCDKRPKLFIFTTLNSLV